MTRFRRAGTHWRFLVHDMVGRSNGISRHVKSHPREGLSPTSPDLVDTEWSRTTLMPDTEFDELVVGGHGGHWLHIEQMGDDHYWLSVGGLHINVGVNRDGTARSVMVDVADPQPGVRYLDGMGEEWT